jgi:hypothetical protein
VPIQKDRFSMDAISHQVTAVSQNQQTSSWLNADRRKRHPEIPDLWIDANLNVQAPRTDFNTLNHDFVKKK